MQAELTTPRGVYERLGDVTIVDVREPYEWNAGRIDCAIAASAERSPASMRRWRSASEIMKAFL